MLIDSSCSMLLGHGSNGLRACPGDVFAVRIGDPKAGLYRNRRLLETLDAAAGGGEEVLRVPVALPFV